MLDRRNGDFKILDISTKTGFVVFENFIFRKMSLLDFPAETFLFDGERWMTKRFIWRKMNFFLFFLKDNRLCDCFLFFQKIL